MMKHFMGRHPQPYEYLTLILCRDIYHCTPSELARQDPQVILAHLTALDVESDYRSMHNAPKVDAA